MHARAHTLAGRHTQALTELIGCTTGFLLQGPDAKQSDIKRVFAFRQTLIMLDIAHESCEPLRAELLQCLISPKFLQCNEGQRFLSFLFCLNVDFVEVLHVTIKNTLPYCSKNLVREYGDVRTRTTLFHHNAGTTPSVSVSVALPLPLPLVLVVWQLAGWCKGVYRRILFSKVIHLALPM